MVFSFSVRTNNCSIKRIKVERSDDIFTSRYSHSERITWKHHTRFKMCGQTHCGYFLTCLTVFCGLTVAQMPAAQRPNSCYKFDFDKPANQFAPAFIIKGYNNVTNPTPYRPYYHSFLTNKSPGYSFAQPNMVFTLNQTSMIEALVYFQPVGAAYFDISVRDVRSNTVTQILHITTFTSWQIFVKNIAKMIPDGRVTMRF